MSGVCFIHDGMGGFPERPAVAQARAEGQPEGSGVYLCDTCATALADSGVDIVWLDKDEEEEHPVTYTLVLIDADPEHAEDGDFLHVEGVTLTDLHPLSRGQQTLSRFGDAMRARIAREIRNAR